MTKRFTIDEMITAILATPTITEAAKNLGCSTRTVYNYMEQDGFREAMEAAQRERDQRLSDVLDSATVAAIEKLAEILREDASSCFTSTTVPDQLEAARILLISRRMPFK